MDLFSFPLVFVAAWTLCTLGAGGWVTDTGAWYRGLRKPPWQPPDWLFGPAWTTIFVCASAAFVLAWRAAAPGDVLLRGAMLAAYGLNGALNVLWSWLFFRLRRTDLALAETAPLWLSVAAMAACVGMAHPAAALLLLPYLAWVAFAAVLNRAILRLNAPPA